MNQRHLLGARFWRGAPRQISERRMLNRRRDGAIATASLRMAFRRSVIAKNIVPVYQRRHKSRFSVQGRRKNASNNRRQQPIGSAKGSTMKKVLMIVAAGLASLVTLMVARTLIFFSPSNAATQQIAMASDPAEANRLAQLLSQAITYRTISLGQGRPINAAGFNRFNIFLADAFPAIHAVAEKQLIADHSLMLRWPGSGDGAPIALLAHSDVVPVEPGTERSWTHPPYAGVIEDGRVWGRGALDNKGQLIAIMAAADRLASKGFQPERDVYFLFGHDEELGGGAGAAAMVAALEAQGVSLAMTLDEGSGVVDGIIAAAENPLALIATAEKGSTSLKLSATARGGHSSTPGPDSAVSLVSRAIVAVNDDPYPLKIDKNVVAFLHGLAPELPLAQRVILTNLWITGPFVKDMLGADPNTAASLRTTTASTMISGGVKINILPQTADAFVNYRIHPRDTPESVLARATKQIDDSRIDITVLGATPASPQSSRTSPAYAAIAQSVHDVFGPIAIAPSLTLQGTDSKHYVEIAEDTYRFTPFIYDRQDLTRIHGTDEFVTIENLARATDWYERFIERAATN